MHKIRKDFDLKKLSTMTLDISDLKITYQIWHARGKTGLLLKIAGKYGPGSGGANDARYIRWKIAQVFDHPEVFIHGYEWGDDIYISPPNSCVPYLVYLQKDKQEKYAYFVDKEKMRFQLRTALA